MRDTEPPEDSVGPRPTRVGIGLIHRDGSYLVRRRPPLPGSPLAGYWEFPGGKCQGRESPAEATARECREELGIPVVLGPLRRMSAHNYPHGRVELHFYDGVTEGPDDEPARDSGFVWVAARDLAGLRFPEANGPILEELAGEAGREGPP
jgi:8-oxo-dGTP diphosphatase